jgi:hypothetical protein
MMLLTAPDINLWNRLHRDKTFRSWGMKGNSHICDNDPDSLFPARDNISLQG